MRRLQFKLLHNTNHNIPGVIGIQTRSHTIHANGHTKKCVCFRYTRRQSTPAMVAQNAVFRGSVPYRRSQLCQAAGGERVERQASACRSSSLLGAGGSPWESRACGHCWSLWEGASTSRPSQTRSWLWVSGGMHAGGACHDRRECSRHVAGQHGFC